MKFVSSAIAAIVATRYDIDSHGVEEFVSGFVFGLIGKDDLPDIEKCLQDESALEQEITNAIADISKGDLNDIIKGVMEIGQIVKELPTDLAQCKNIQADVEKIIVWAQKFTNPTELAVIVAKNLLKHWKNVVSDVKKTESDWKAADYYNAGDDVADLLIQAVGAPTGKEFAEEGPIIHEWMVKTKAILEAQQQTLNLY